MKTPLATERFLIIGGTSKAGTTSVFNYLANHPQICPSLAKESRFFLDADYPLESDKRYEKDGSDAYLSFFDSKHASQSGAWRLEATPDYLYSRNTPRAICNTLPNVKFVFILREPISRLLSWYRFGQAMNKIPAKMTLEEYIQVQADGNDPFPKQLRHPAFGALWHGRYSFYLKRFVDLFGASSIHVVFYEELRRDPRSFMSSICNQIGIDDTYFRNYNFEVMNRGMRVRNPRFHLAYFELTERLRKWVQYAPGLRPLLRGMRRRTDALYDNINVVKDSKITMSGAINEFLHAYYQGEPAALNQLIGIQAPWSEHGCIETHDGQNQNG